MKRLWFAVAITAMPWALPAVDYPKESILEQRQQLKERQVEQKLWDRDRQAERLPQPKQRDLVTPQRPPQKRPLPPLTR